MSSPYSQQTWVDRSSQYPTSAARMLHMEQGLGSAGVYYNVKDTDYGALGDGVTNDVTALTAAVTAVGAAGGGVVMIPPGTYALGSTWTINQDNVTVLAYGASFVPKAGVSGCIKAGAAGATIDNFRWFGGSYDGTGGSNFCFAMSCFFGTGCVVEDYTYANTATTNANGDGVILSGDGRLLTDAVATATSTTIASATAAFTSDDVGKTVIVWGAGAGGCAFEAYIDSVTSSASAVMSSAALTTVSGARMNVATYQGAVFRNLRGTNCGGDGFRANTNACGATVENLFLHKMSTAGTTKGAVMCNGAPYVTFKNPVIDGSGGYGLRMMGLHNVAVAPRVTNWQTTNDAIRMCEEGIHVVAPEVNGGTSGYGVRMTNDSGLSTAPIGMRLTGGFIRDCGGVKIDFFGPNGAAPESCSIDTTVMGSTQDGVFINAGSHHVIRGTFRGGGRDGIRADNVSDCVVDALCYGNANYGVRTTGTSDRWRVAGASRAAENTSGATSLTGAGNNTAALIT